MSLLLLFLEVVQIKRESEEEIDNMNKTKALQVVIAQILLLL